MASDTKQTRLQTLDQRRAAHAWSVVQRLKESASEAVQKEFGREAKRLPARILCSGLGQTLAFLKAKGTAKDLRQALSEWVLARRAGQEATGPDALLEAIIERDADFLRLATAEAIAYSQWLARFVEAEGFTQSDTGSA